MNHREPQAQPVSPSMQMMQILWPGAMAVQAIHVAAKLALADFVANGPKSISELAEAKRMHGPSIAPFLRALTSLGIFVEDSAGRYRETALSAFPVSVSTAARRSDTPRRFLPDRDGKSGRDGPLLERHRNGGKESQCGWCKDRWGLSWQITPRALTDALAAGGAEAKCLRGDDGDDQNRHRHYRGSAARLTVITAEGDR